MSGLNLPALGIKPVSRISPSRYYSFTICRLKEILAANRKFPLLPVSPAARIGSVVHKIIEIANTSGIENEKRFNDLWQIEINKCEESMINNPIEKHMVPLEETASNYEIKKLMALKMISSIFNEDWKKVPNQKEKFHEKWLETKDKRIGGKIDQIQKTTEGAVIIDYKTGNVVNGINGELKEDYILQLKLYAGLYYENFKTWPVKLLLAGIDQSLHEIPFSPSECKVLLDQARNLLSETNNLISKGLSEEDFASPSPAACKYCLYRPGCKKYWQKREDAAEWPVDIIGCVEEKGFSGNKLGRIVIKQGEAKYVVRALSSRHSFLYGTKKNILMCNLGNDTSINHYIEQIMTTGYGF